METVTFRLSDSGRLAGVRLYQEVRITDLDFARAGAEWVLVAPRPPVNRMEYLFELRHRDGSRETILDPASSARAVGVFGDKSVHEFPEYIPPHWLTAAALPGYWSRSPGMTLWSPIPQGDGLPLLVVHDGPEYDQLALLTRYLSAGLTGGWLPPVRAALLHPGDRNVNYSASLGYTSGLELPEAPVRVGMGTSLGALAMLYAHRRRPPLFDALFLQSGSFFHPRFDAHEERFPFYGRIVAFVEETLAGVGAWPLRAVLTCGGIEENIHNNRQMAEALRMQGYEVIFGEMPDVHNYTAWRDAFDPYLTRLLQDVCA
ncbi:hypothetical protein ACIBG8_51355 [Nonomuraea sp. NPDC050556]|uniref:hypothetical protein n=1 Tax=Nonomuraea sp. NPDC050556 TaxID=3364369 RepID=UPI0037B8DF7E